MSDASDEERFALAARFDRYARLVALAIANLALIAVLDLSTGWLGRDWRLDVALLASALMGVWGVHTMHQLAKCLRSGIAATLRSKTHWALSCAGIALAIAICTGIGYLAGGEVLAIASPMAVVVLTAIAMALGVRERRRRRASAP